MKFRVKNCFGQKSFFEALWNCHFLKISITCPRVRQIQDLGRSKYKLRISSKGLATFQKFFSIWVSMNTQQAWKAKLEGALSFDIHNCKKTRCVTTCKLLVTSILGDSRSTSWFSHTFASHMDLSSIGTWCPPIQSQPCFNYWRWPRWDII